MSWIIGAIGAAVAWLLWQFLGQLLGEIAWWALGPIRRPISSAFEQASWPWPMLVMLLCGAAVAVTGLLMLSRGDWLGTLGAPAFVFGTGFALGAPFLWRDARRTRGRRMASPNEEL
jgi:hypothetical protein